MRPPRSGPAVRGAVVIAALLVLRGLAGSSSPPSPNPVIDVPVEAPSPRDGIDVSTRFHDAVFSSAGLSFSPQGSALTWSWSFLDCTMGDEILADAAPVVPVPIEDRVEYARGVVTEEYVLGGTAIEQRFVLHDTPAAGDLVIRGRVGSDASFRTTSSGWAWRAQGSGVSLGDVTAFDGDGNVIAADLLVSATETSIVIAGDVLARATLPILIDPVIEAEMFPISYMGADHLSDGRDPAIALDASRARFLVVWYGDDDGTGADEEFNIWGRLVDATTGDPVAPQFRISDTWPTGSRADHPDVVYNVLEDEFLVVWSSDELALDEFEIMGQRILAATGELIGTSFRISDMGNDGITRFAAIRPAVEHDPIDNEYLVIWSGDDGHFVGDDEFEIFGQRLDGTSAAEIGVDFAISQQGPDLDPAFDAVRPALTYDPDLNLFLAVWIGTDDTPPLVPGEREVFGQRIAGGTGALVGVNERLTHVGVDGAPQADATSVDVTYNPSAGEYLVVFRADPGEGSLADDEYEIFALRLDSDLAGIGTESRISDMGPDGDPSYDAFDYPSVIYAPPVDRYLVVWSGDDDTGTLVNDDREIFGQGLDGLGAEIGGDLRLSTMGPDGSTDYRQRVPVAAYAAGPERVQIVWQGQSDVGYQASGDDEVFGLGIDATSGELDDTPTVISTMGSLGQNVNAIRAASAYNAVDREYLVVWAGGPESWGGFLLWGQRIDGTTRDPIGPAFQISDGIGVWGAHRPSVTHDPDDGVYAVIWMNDERVATKPEIFGRILDAQGDPLTDTIRISEMGADDPDYHATHPSVAYNSGDREFYVVWQGANDTPTKYEIHGRRLSATGDLGPQSRISFSGSDEAVDPDGERPQITYDSTNGFYLVTWISDVFSPDWPEVYGQRLDATTAAPIGGNVRITDTGDAGAGLFDLDAVFVPGHDAHIVAWTTRHGGRYRVWAQFVDAVSGLPDGPEIVVRDTRFIVYRVAIGYSAYADEALVVWDEDDLFEGSEILGQSLDVSGRSMLGSSTHISLMGGLGQPQYAGQRPAIPRPSHPGTFLVAWQGDSHEYPWVDGDVEIFGRFVGPEDLLAAPTSPVAPVVPSMVATPNPFSARTALEVEIPTPGPATVRVFDVGGREVTTLHDGHLDVGRRRWSWDGRDDAGARVAPGMYLVRLEHAHGVSTGKLLLVE